MNLDRFRLHFDYHFPESERDQPSPVLEQAFTRSYFDPCFGVQGYTSVKVQHLLNTAYLCLDDDECYLEIGSFQGKTLISAMLNNAPRTTYACDNFSEFTTDAARSFEVFQANLRHFGLAERVTFFNEDFRGVLDPKRLEKPVGVYLYDGGHTEAEHRDAITLAEPVLADRALVIIDDWNFDGARRGAESALAASRHRWERLYLLPARGPEERPAGAIGDHGMWWNGVAVYGFERA